MALTPLPALWKTPLRFITVLGFNFGKVSLVTPPSREGRAVLKEMRKEIEDKRRTKMLLFSAPKSIFFSLGQNPIFGGVSRTLHWAANTIWARPVIPAKTNNLEEAPTHQSHLADVQHRGASQDIPSCQTLPLEAVGMLLSAPTPSGTLLSQSITRCVTSIHSRGAVPTNVAAFPKENTPILVTDLAKPQSPSLKTDSRHGSEVLTTTDPSCHSSEPAPDPSHSSPPITHLNI